MTILDEILAATRTRLESLQEPNVRARLRQAAAAAAPARGLERALRGAPIGLIAEIKRASPRSGPLDLGADAGALARRYAESGARAVSVLTEPDFFKGSLDDLGAARSAGIPVLRKDFILDPVQIVESRAAGADAVLVIVRIGPGRVEELVATAHEHGMDALVEVYDAPEVDIAVRAGARIIGINNRDLTSFEVDISRSAEVARNVPADALVVALSGLAHRRDVEQLRAAGIHAFLVGEALMRSSDPGAAIAELVGAP